MHRGWMEHPVFGGKREPFCKRAAWAWMIEQAQWQDRKIGVGGKTVELRRGQFSHSYRYMAAAWGWSLAGVQRFIERLSADTMVSTASDTGQLVVTLCNYTKYQSSQPPADTAVDTPTDTKPIQDRYATDTNKKEVKKERKIPVAKATGAVDPVAEVFEIGKALLAEYGFSPSKAGALIQLWRKTIPPPLLKTIFEEAGLMRRHDIVAYLTACIRAQAHDQQADETKAERSSERVRLALARQPEHLRTGLGLLPDRDVDAVLPAVQSG